MNAALNPMNAEHLKVYACPQWRSNLKATAGSLECANCGKSYQIHDGIPDFLLEDLVRSAHPVLRKVLKIDLLARIYETRLWYSQVLRLATGRRVLHCASKWGLRGFEVPTLEQMLGEAGFESCHFKTSC